MSSHNSNPAVVLHHDGELQDVRQLLADLGVDFVEKVGEGHCGIDPSACALIIATPRRILRLESKLGGGGPKLIAVLDSDSRTLRSHLRRMSVDVMVRRPVHPEALRLLILHSLYSGPERRSCLRVSVGAEIGVRVGMRRQTATLAELSPRGCRLLSRRRLDGGRRIKLRLSGGLTGGRTLRLPATVTRSRPAEDGGDGWVIGVSFDPLTPRLATQLHAVIERHRTGPAVMAEPLEGDRGEAQAAGMQPEQRPAAPPPDDSEAAPAHFESLAASAASGAATSVSHEHEGVEAAEELEQAAEPRERRAAGRHAYEKRVVALGERATRVLIGRDISTDGMRVDEGSGLEVGDLVQIALHGLNLPEPLIVRAHVQRVDGAGMVLLFQGLVDESKLQLAALIEQLPLLSGAEEEEQRAGIVVSEIIDREAS